MPFWLKAAVGLLPISLILFTYERALLPLYGSGPVNHDLNTVILTTSLAIAILPFRISTTHIWLYAALGLSLAPNATYWVAVWTSRWGDPVWGPTVTHAVVLAPLIFSCTSYVIEMGAVSPDSRTNLTVLNLVTFVPAVTNTRLIEKSSTSDILPFADGRNMLRDWDLPL